MRRSLAIIVIIAIHLQSFAQQDLIGRILDFDTNKPIATATVSIEGSQSKTVTNFLGYFKLQMDTSNVLIIEREGYESGILKVPSMQNFQVKLKKINFENLTEVKTKYEEGALKDNVKIGIWKYYDQPGELALKLNYTTGNMLFIKPDTSKYTIEMENKWVNKSLDVFPRPIGSMTEFYNAVNSTIRYPLVALRNSTVGKLYVSFEIDTMGHAINFEVINDIGDGCGLAVVNALQICTKGWLVANKDDRFYKSRFLLPVNFRIKAERREFRDGRNSKNLEALPIAYQLNEIEILAEKITRSMTTRH